MLGDATTVTDQLSTVWIVTGLIPPLLIGRGYQHSTHPSGGASVDVDGGGGGRSFGCCVSYSTAEEALVV